MVEGWGIGKSRNCYDAFWFRSIPCWFRIIVVLTTMSGVASDGVFSRLSLGLGAGSLVGDE